MCVCVCVCVRVSDVCTPLIIGRLLETSTSLLKGGLRGIPLPLMGLPTGASAGVLSPAPLDKGPGVLECLGSSEANAVCVGGCVTAFELGGNAISPHLKPSSEPFWCLSLVLESVGTVSPMLARWRGGEERSGFENTPVVSGGRTAVTITSMKEHLFY